jgi:hypothetical protein
MADVATTFREEEASTKTTLLETDIGDSAGNRGFSYTGQPIKPENSIFIISIYPVMYLL